MLPRLTRSGKRAGVLLALFLVIVATGALLLDASLTTNLGFLTGTAGLGPVTASPTELNFGPVALEVKTHLQFVELNNGNASEVKLKTALSFNDLNVDFQQVGAGGKETAVPRCGATLAGNSKCQIAIQATPKRVGEHTGTLAIAAGGARYDVSLTVYGVDPAAANPEILQTLAQSSSTGGPPPAPTMTKSQYVVDIAISSNANRNAAENGCPVGYVRDSTNLNAGAGGDYIYLCKKFAADRSQAMSYLKVQILDAANRDRACEVAGGVRVEKMASELNKGAGGQWIYFCKGWPTDLNADWRAVKDIAFHVYNYMPLYPLVAICSSGQIGAWPGGWDIVTGEPPEAPARLDLNAGAGGQYLYTCIRYE